MDKRHIISLQGRDYVTYEGLLDEAHKQGLRAIRTQLVQRPGTDNEQTAICLAEIELVKDGEVRLFSGIGDASPRNVSRGVALHLIRMAETRAKARAMRDATNVGITAFEELVDADLPREVGDGAGGGGATANIATLPMAKARPEPAVAEPLATKAQIDRVTREMKRTGLTPERGRAYLQEHFGKSSRLELTSPEIERFIAYLKALPAAPATAKEA